MNTKYLKFILGAALLLSGIFSARAQTTPTPGGVTTPYYWSAWLKPDNYTSGNWRNSITSGAYAAGNFTSRRPTTQWLNVALTPPILINGNNFHQKLNFTKSAQANDNARLVSENMVNFDINNRTVIIMFDRPVATYQNMFTFNRVGYGNLAWYASSANLRWSVSGLIDAAVTVTTENSGLLTLDNSNAGGPALERYLNGNNLGPVTLASQNHSSQYLGIASGGPVTGYGYVGNIQEIIVLSAGGIGSHISNIDLQRIHSYLAIKYGLTLNNMDNYYIGTKTVWNRSLNTSYNNHIFGLARDDASALDQRQSRSASNNMITIFRGPTLYTLNSSNTNAFAANETYVMLGSNGQYNGKVDYVFPEGASFAEGSSITEKTNYRTNTVYLAQVINGPQNISIRVTSSNQRYVLVSDNSSFPQASTRVYPIVGLTATNVRINQGEYISFAGFESSPGGISFGSTYKLDLWVDGNNSTETSWTNLAIANYSLQRFSTANVPVVRNSRFNFQKELFFGNTTSSKLRTSTSYKLDEGTSYHIFAVSESNTATHSTILTFGNYLTNGPSTTAIPPAAVATSLRWHASASTIFHGYWSTTPRAFTTIYQTARYGITSLNIVNANNSLSNEMSLNGVTTKFGLGAALNSTGASNTNYPLQLGNSYTGATATYSAFPLNGAIQEVIIIKRPTGSLMSETDVAKIHSYLAIKYGLSLRAHIEWRDNGADYLASDGTSVWSRGSNIGYNNHIFGIGRDDMSGLRQKQSRSVSSRGVTVHVGELTPLNSQNTGALDDMHYLLIGSQNDGRVVMPIEGGIIANDATYKNGPLNGSEDFNIQSSRHKVQLTVPSADTQKSMTVKLVPPSKDLTHILVSSRADFDPAFTNGYEVESGEVEVTFGVSGTDPDNYRFFKFIGFAPGPGGVTSGLALWLRADDEASIDILNLDPQNAQVANFLEFKGAKLDDPTNVPAVNMWSDLARNKTYSYDAGNSGTGDNATTTANHRYPVMKYHSPEMNYYPAVNFYGRKPNPGTGCTGSVNTNSFGAFLANPQGILTTAQPAEHTAVFLVNNDFGSNAWVYPMMFGSATGICSPDPGTYGGPGYGVQKTGTGSAAKTVGRFRTSMSQGVGNVDLFKSGSTSILNYQVNGDNGQLDNRSVIFRFNGKGDPTINGTGSNGLLSGKYQFGIFNMTAGSQIGKGYQYDRTIIGDMSEVIIYDRALTKDETTRMESYLALKYGITLSPSDLTTYNRFNYKLSDGRMIWEGGQPDGSLYAKFYNNVAAIVRDDMASLNNRQTHSTNVGSILHVGVAGSYLSFDGKTTDLGSLENMEFVAFGNDTRTDIVQIPSHLRCGGFEERFGRVWLINKGTENNRPIDLLFAAQNNSMLTIGDDPEVMNVYYPKLSESYDVYMCVATSLADIESNNFLMTIPMEYINGEHQCNYTVENTHTYITFGFRANGRGCATSEDAMFQGTKYYRWLNWTVNTNRNTGTGAFNVVSAPGVYGNLGDNIVVTDTRLEKPAVVRLTSGYPRATSTLGQGTLQVTRVGGGVGVISEMTVRVDFNTPVIPQFSIGGIDAWRRCYEEVEIYGECNTGSGVTRFLPTLTAATATPTYRITGNKATCYRDVSATATNRNTVVNVAFRGGVTSLFIKYRITGTTNTTIRNIWISPIALGPVLPPPKVNIDGLSFVKRVDKPSYQSCEFPVFTFEIGNNKCDHKPVMFRDTLPNLVEWEPGSIGLSGPGIDINPKFNPEIITLSDGRQVLKIDSLAIPGGDKLTINATAKFSELFTDANSGFFRNRAKIEYKRTEASVDIDGILWSYDNSNPNPLERDYTSFYVEYAPNPEKVVAGEIYSKATYREGDEIMVRYTLTNPNSDNITDAFFDIEYNEEFSLVTGSMNIAWDNPGETTPVPVYYANALGTITVCGTLTGTGDPDEGFTLPNTSPLIITFKLKAPENEADLAKELDDKGNEVISPLRINYYLTSVMEDPCLIKAVEDCNGEIVIPYGTSRTHIITNKNVTTKLYD